MTPLQKLTEVFKAEALSLRSIERDFYSISFASGNISKLPWIISTSLKNMASSASSFEEKDGELIFTRTTSVRLNDSLRLKGEGASNTLTGTIVTRVFKGKDGKTYSERINSVRKAIALEYLNDSINALQRSQAVEALGETATEEELAEWLATDRMKFDLYYPEIDKEVFSIAVSETLVGNTVEIEGELLKNGEPLNERSGVDIPVGYTISVRPSSGIKGVPNSLGAAQADFTLAGGAKFKFSISTNLNESLAYQIGSPEGVKLLVQPKWKDSTAKTVRGSYEVELVETKNLIYYDLFNLDSPEPIVLELDAYVWHPYIGNGGSPINLTKLNGERMFPPGTNPYYPRFKIWHRLNGEYGEWVEIQNPDLNQLEAKYAGVQKYEQRILDLETGQEYNHEEWAFLNYSGLEEITAGVTWNPNGEEIPKWSQITG